MLNDILYVEDNLDHAELVLRQLERRNLRERVMHIEDGERAIAYLDGVSTGDSARPRLVLLDLRLPRVDGMDVLSHIKSSRLLRDIPVVIFTTSTTQQDMTEAYERYANSYLVKPDDLTELNHVLDEVSHYWLDTNRRSSS